MCLSIPVRIKDIDGKQAKATLGGSIIDISIELVNNVKPGDYVLVHAGFAIEKISSEEAYTTLNLLDELES